MSNINIFVLDFLKQYDSEGLMVKQWESLKNQKKLKKVIKNSTSKDPSKPKRGKSGFLFFCDEMRPIIKLSNNQITVKEVVSQLGVMWQQLKLEGKIEKYEKESEKDRKRYRTEMENYKMKVKKVTTSNVTIVAPPRTPKTPCGVKKTPREKKNTPLENYIKSKKNKVKEKNPVMDEETIVEHLKEKWKKLSTTKKNKYN